MDRALGLEMHKDGVTSCWLKDRHVLRSLGVRGKHKVAKSPPALVKVPLNPRTEQLHLHQPAELDSRTNSLMGTQTFTERWSFSVPLERLPSKLAMTTRPVPQIQHANRIGTTEVLATVTRTESSSRHADVFLAPSKVGYGIKIPLNSN